MKLMDAVVVSGPGPDGLTIAQVPVPQVGANELLVRIRAVGVGIHDSYFLPRELTFPYPIGIEAAGVVERVGRAAAGYQVGDRIAFVSAMQPKGGVWAQYAAVSTDALILPIPNSMSFEEAAAVPVAGNTTLRALHALGSIPPDGAIFVAGGSGAIGTFSIQLARRRGWAVAASASPRNHDYLAELGTSLAVDYHDANWPDRVRSWRRAGVDGALAVQPETTRPTMAVVREGGVVVTISGDQVPPADGVSVSGLAYQVDVRGELLTLLGDIESGRIRLEIEAVYPFQEAMAALAKVATRRARGKVVLTMD